MRASQEAAAGPHRPRHPDFDVDFERAPLLVIWEVTRACDLACKHCRAAAQPLRNPFELTTEEGFRLIDEIADMGTPLLVLTGGDPLKRPDLAELVAHGVSRGLHVSLSPSVTPLVTREALARLREAGVDHIAFSLDGSTPEVHDGFRQIPGTFDATVRAVKDAREAGMTVRLLTTVSVHNRWDLPRVARLVEDLGAVVWNLFFLVPTGRGKQDDCVSAEEHEAIFEWLDELSRTTPFQIKTTEGMHYRRVQIQRRRLVSTGRAAAGAAGHGHGRRQWVNDAKGFCFVSHTGRVCPSGFLPVSAGNVRRTPLAELYRNSQLFRDLRDASRLKGKCGACEFKEICGGSRARAYAFTGDYLAEEPRCAYIPEAWRGERAAARS